MQVWRTFVWEYNSLCNKILTLYSPFTEGPIVFYYILISSKRSSKRRGLSGRLWEVVLYRNQTTGCLFQDEFLTRLKIIHCKQFLFRKIYISILFVIALLILYVSRNVQRTDTSDHVSSGQLQEVVVYERFELKGVDGALDRRSHTTCGRIRRLTVS